ncbi:class I SAM-dependent methyltransferase [Streptomyces triticagri]|uniref:Class I SAM-dependent methyltransferase n=1 Tax=Streptomyces triticagri TaxID=2293568 RepID=A0A372LYV3_9ACTN|nr:class I SAM-dependent methyltransferase [Streptomyces triticagri]RFU83864.1 class I SAM-dependent methyltransferase [Streptomyces triticagri]
MSEGYEDRPEEGGPDRRGQAEAFDALGERYDEAFPHKEGQLASGEWLIKRLPPHSRVLDVGCGTGLPTARQLADAGHRVTGVDLSARMVELARQNVPEGEFLQRDIAFLEAEGPQGIGQFEGIACFFSLLMLPRREIPETLGRLREMLVPRGLISLSMVEADLDDTVIPFIGETIRVSGYLRDELRQVVRDAGLEIAGEDSYAYAPASATTAPEHQLFLYCRRV